MTRDFLNSLFRRRDLLANVYQSIGEYTRAYNVRGCMKTQYAEKDTSTAENVEIDWSRTWLCKDPLCPCCKWRKIRRKIYTISDYWNEFLENTQYPDYIFRMLTLTVPNVKLEKLADTLSGMNSAWQDLRKTNKLKYERAVKGTIRIYEITYNEETDTYHPHYHILTAHTKSYGTNPDYTITVAEWSNWWRAAVGNPNLQDAVVTKIKEPQNIAYALATKQEKELPFTDDTVSVLLPTLKGRRNGIPTGIFRHSQKSSEDV